MVETRCALSNSVTASTSQGQRDVGAKVDPSSQIGVPDGQHADMLVPHDCPVVVYASPPPIDRSTAHILRAIWRRAPNLSVTLPMKE